VENVAHEQQFGDGKCGIEHSPIFLQSYFSLFHDNTDCELLANPKGKQPASSHGATREVSLKEQLTLVGPNLTKGGQN
jgi:hypothetical protein